MSRRIQKDQIIPFFLGFGACLVGHWLLFQGSGNRNDVNPNQLPAKPKQIAMNVSTEVLISGNNSVSEDLYQNVRILCWVMTGSASHHTKAIHVKHTWGKRCNKILFMSSTADDELPTVQLTNVKEGREYLWLKTQEAFKTIYQNHFDDVDWFLKADDDSYVILENLRFLLKDYNTADPLFFGQRLKQYGIQGYMTGGAGYVLSKEALRLFVTKALPDNSKCSTWDWLGYLRTHAEDTSISDCLTNVGVQFVDSRDKLGRHRFNQLAPENLLLDIGISGWLSLMFYKQTPGFECCSEAIITFHYVKPEEMYILEYFIYRVQVYGRLGTTNWSQVNRGVRKMG